MHFTYDHERDRCFVHLRDSAVVSLQALDPKDPDGRFVLTIDEAGKVLGIDVRYPGASPWPVRELLTRYPFDVDEAWFLVTIAERYSLFKFDG